MLYALYFNEDGDTPLLSVYPNREAFIEAQDGFASGEVIDPEKFDKDYSTGWLLIEGEALKKIVRA